MSRLQIAKKLFISLLIAAAAILVTVQLFRLLLLPGLQTFFVLDEAATSLVRRAGIFLSVLIAYWGYVKFYEKRAVTELTMAPIGIAVGAGVAILLVAAATLPLFVFGVYEVTLYRGAQSGLWGVAAVILIAAFLEEVVYRGLLFKLLEEAIGTSWALWLQALIFSAAHISNFRDAGLAASILGFVSGTLLGAFWGYIFIQTRNLWIVTANHAAWNYAIILTGTPLSGIDVWRKFAPIESTSHGPFWLSGGGAGPEDSIVTVTIILICLVVQMRMHRSAKQKKVAIG